jgi:hypothetical protein
MKPVADNGGFPDPHRRAGLRRLSGLAADAWLFLSLLLLVVGALVVIRPISLLDRRRGTNLAAPLVRLVKWIGDL